MLRPMVPFIRFGKVGGAGGAKDKTITGPKTLRERELLRLHREGSTTELNIDYLFV